MFGAISPAGCLLQLAELGVALAAVVAVLPLNRRAGLAVAAAMLFAATTSAGAVIATMGAYYHAFSTPTSASGTTLFALGALTFVPPLAHAIGLGGLAWGLAELAAVLSAPDDPVQGATPPSSGSTGA